MKKILFFCILSFMFSGLLLSQNNDSIQYPTFQFEGVLKTKFEWATEEGSTRFGVRNSRLGVSGQVIPKLKYNAKIELSDEGDFKVLDVNGTYQHNDYLSIKIGQFSLPIFNSYTTDPGTMMFANRTFLAKYYMSTRDIGMLVTYDFPQFNIPVRAEIGVFNGNSSNTVKWADKKSFSGRLTLGDMQGLRSTFKFYDNHRLGESEDEFLHHFTYGADVRYAQENWKIESEALIKKDLTVEIEYLAAYLQSAYAFQTRQDGLIKHIIPAVRYDFLDQNRNIGNFDVQRLSVGLGLGLDVIPFQSILRIDYEWYFENNLIPMLNETDEMNSDKISLELVLMF